MKKIIKQYLKEQRGLSRPKLIKKLDKAFSTYLIGKHKKCFKCGGVNKLGVSHYFSRKYTGTRWDEDNCDVACWGCHYYHLEHFKTPGEFYTRYMYKKLGEKKFLTLEAKAHSVTKFSTMDLIFLLTDLESKLKVKE